MKAKIAEDIKCTAYFGYVYPDEIKRFDDKDLCNKDNLFQNRLSKIKVFVGDKNGKQLILGLQTIYMNVNGDLNSIKKRFFKRNKIFIKLFK